MFHIHEFNERRVLVAGAGFLLRRAQMRHRDPVRVRDLSALTEEDDLGPGGQPRETIMPLE